MGGQAGWVDPSQGTLENVVSAGGGRCLPAGGGGRFQAEVPRYAWFHPPTVAISATFRFHRVNGQLLLTGVGRLLKTDESPVASSFTVAGTATLTRSGHRSCTATRWSGALTLAFAVS
jgi:hypothetical protein